MPFPVTCPECDFTQSVPDEVAGKRLRCKGCKAVFRAGNADVDIVDEGPPPARKGGRRTAGRKSKSALPLVLGAVGGLFVLLTAFVVGVGYFTGLFDGPAKPKTDKATEAAGAGGGKLVFGIPPPMRTQQAVVTVTRAVENGRDGLNISFQFVRGHRQAPDHVLVVQTPGGGETLFLDRATMGGPGQPPVRVDITPGRDARFEIWVGRLRPGANLSEAPDRVSDVVRID